jgi:hypothetical protein
MAPPRNLEAHGRAARPNGQGRKTFPAPYTHRPMRKPANGAVNSDAVNRRTVKNNVKNNTVKNNT